MNIFKKVRELIKIEQALRYHRKELKRRTVIMNRYRGRNPYLFEQFAGLVAFDEARISELEAAKKNLFKKGS